MSPTLDPHHMAPSRLPRACLSLPLQHRERGSRRDHPPACLFNPGTHAWGCGTVRPHAGITMARARERGLLCMSPCLHLPLSPLSPCVLGDVGWTPRSARPCHPFVTQLGFFVTVYLPTSSLTFLKVCLHYRSPLVPGTLKRPVSHRTGLLPPKSLCVTYSTLATTDLPLLHFS